MFVVEFEDAIRGRRRRRYQLRPPAEAATLPGNTPHDYLRRSTEQALDHLLTPQLKRMLRYTTITVFILVLADLLSSSNSGTACGLGVIQPAYPMTAGEAARRNL
jgi:hypothetical protein